MWDSVNSDLITSLCLKAVQNNIGVTIFMTLVKFVPLTTVSMVENCSPFLVIVLAFFILQERTSMLQFFATLIAVIGASTVILGGN